MTDYRKMYHVLFNGVTQAIRQLENDDVLGAAQTLITAQQQTEEIYMDTAEEH